MDKYLQFLIEEDGKQVHQFKDDLGFMAFILDSESGEMYVSHLFIPVEKRSLTNAIKCRNEIEKMAELFNCTYITGTVFLKEGNKDRFIKKLKFYDYLGFKPNNITNNAVIVKKEL